MRTCVYRSLFLLLLPQVCHKKYTKELTILHKIRNEITFTFLQILDVARRPQESTRLIVKRSPRRQSEFTKYKH